MCLLEWIVSSSSYENNMLPFEISARGCEKFVWKHSETLKYVKN